jgi:hypothetical protein
VEAEYRADGKRLDNPTYTITTADGHDEKHAIDATMLDTLTSEQRAEWDAYKRDSADFEAEATRRIGNAMLLLGLDLGEPPAEWLEQMQWIGLPVPEDPKERKLMYIETAVLLTPSDQMGVMSKIVTVSAQGVPEEEIRAIEATFRSAFQRSLAGAVSTSIGGLDVQSDVSGSGSGDGVEATEKPV